ncbi:glucosidase [Candidatus Aerophobetes bacterium]|uniref:Glucosidase n=1 Tax=Aerophobetes bacterium TaxID=2030807 RepID=A0A2A4X7J6_UNCAE|nr:MAG: glucosidase [Candidatus Aerophobetes bacterium]
MKDEKKRQKQQKSGLKQWDLWGPYLAERAWGTVREDYSKDSNPWEFTYDMARYRAYRWGEDGIAGISDFKQNICFSLSFWNGQDAHLKERLFGLNNGEGNHGEDVKEYYFYLDNTPTHSYMRYLYKYPQGAFPYDQLRKAGRDRGQGDREYELLDTGIFDYDRYFDVFVEYAKQDMDDIFVKISVHNRGNEERELHLLPTFWAKNNWFAGKNSKPKFHVHRETREFASIQVDHSRMGGDPYFLYGEKPESLLFTDNETNRVKMDPKSTWEGHSKDGFNAYVVGGEKEAVRASREGTKSAFHYVLKLKPLESCEVVLRLTKQAELKSPFSESARVFKARETECREFYQELLPHVKNEDHFNIAKGAFSGLLWNKMYYNYIVSDWLEGDPKFHPPLPEKTGEGRRNEEWENVYGSQIFSTPDSWEFPAFYSWDTAFHAISLALVDPEFAKKQLILFMQEYFMHPSGQIPAYDWNLSDVNPPVHAWAAFRVYKIEEKYTGNKDKVFLERIFQKLLLNFTWWVNRKDHEGKNIFSGGFLGLDNISVFDRSKTLPEEVALYQSDATSWMTFYALNMLTISVELAKDDETYEHMANKFFHHFLLISRAINHTRKDLLSLWNEEDGLFYDVLTLEGGKQVHIKVRSLVSLMPLLAVTTISQNSIDSLPKLKAKIAWFHKHEPKLCQAVASMQRPGEEKRILLALIDKEKLIKLLKVMLDEEEFLGPFGIRSVSKHHEQNPFEMKIGDQVHSLSYNPAESDSRLFGGNSNWRGPVWFPINGLIIESLQKFHHYYGNEFKVECPTGSGQFKTLWEVSTFISRRMVKIFEQNEEGERPVFHDMEKFKKDPNFSKYPLFFEYFNGDTGAGLGASHQTGWTAFIAKIIRQLSEYDAM